MVHKRKKMPPNIEARRLTTMTVLAVVMVIFGIVLVGVSFFLPPSGEIHPSVLTAFGEALTFAGGLLGIDTNYRFKVFREQNDRYDNHYDEYENMPPVEDEETQE